MAHICDILGDGRITTIDIAPNANRPFHPRINYLTGSSTDPKIIEKLEAKITKNMNVLVILDSDHSKTHVRQELDLYSKFVTKDSYLIVEDGCVNGHPVHPSFGPGPYEAIDDFLLTNKDFVIDESREKFMMTFNPNGYLKRIS
jgi:cephalosporin hydroxylase